MTKIIIDHLPENADFGWVVEQMKRALGTEIQISQIAEAPQ